MAQALAHPLEVMHHEASGQLEVLWSDGLLTRFTSINLRRACRCAACVQQRRDNDTLDISVDTRLACILPVGEMGLQLVFEDGHDRGIYPWPYLYELSLAQHSEATHEQPV